MICNSVYIMTTALHSVHFNSIFLSSLCLFLAYMYIFHIKTVYWKAAQKLTFNEYISSMCEMIKILCLG